MNDADAMRAFIAGGIAASLPSLLRQVSPEPEKVQVAPTMGGDGPVGIVVQLASGLVFDIAITERV